jgi:methylenetetrahydrofolate reductase (NADPH)
MKITEYFKNYRETQFSFEILPPPKGTSIQYIYDIVDQLIEFDPKYVNVTYHREELTYKKRPDGLLEPRIVRKRPGTVGMTAAIRYKYGVEVVPHIICGGFTQEETENALIDLDFLGVENLLLVRGDVEKETGTFNVKPGGHAHTTELIKQVANLNRGIYLDEKLENSIPTKFSIGVAGYPEKHNEAPNMDCDLRFLKQKIEAGAEYVVTQMFFDNKKYFDFVEACRAAGITVPVIPGLKPVSLMRHINILPSVFHIDLPENLASEIRKCKDNAQVRAVGVEWAIEQTRELRAANVPVIHYYTMGKADNIAQIAKAVF